MKATVKETKNLIEKINSGRWIYEKYDLIWVWWWNYWLYQWDFAKCIWKWIAKWNIKHIFDLLIEYEYSLTIPFQENDLALSGKELENLSQEQLEENQNIENNENINWCNEWR